MIQMNKLIMVSINSLYIFKITLTLIFCYLCSWPMFSRNLAKEKHLAINLTEPDNTETLRVNRGWVGRNRNTASLWTGRGSWGKKRREGGV